MGTPRVPQEQKALERPREEDAPHVILPKTTLTWWLRPVTWKTLPLFKDRACGEMTRQLAFGLAPPGTSE